MKAAALDWLITDTRQEFPLMPPVEHQAIAELLEQHI
jgi:mannose-1-phosphate guanylyltransferase